MYEEVDKIIARLERTLCEVKNTKLLSDYDSCTILLCTIQDTLWKLKVFNKFFKEKEATCKS